MAEGYTIKDMQQLMMSEQKSQREIMEKQTEQLEAIRVHLKELNGKVARHQETLYEKERGIMDRLTKLEGWQIKVMGVVSLLSAFLVIVGEKLINLLF